MINLVMVATLAFTSIKVDTVVYIHSDGMRCGCNCATIVARGLESRDTLAIIHWRPEWGKGYIWPWPRYRRIDMVRPNVFEIGQRCARDSGFVRSHWPNASLDSLGRRILILEVE